MNCNEAQPLLEVMNDGALPTKDCALVLEHLKTCQACQTEQEQIEELRTRFKEAKEQTSAPLDLEMKLSTLLAKEMPSKPAWPAVGIAAVLLVIGLTVFTTFHHQDVNSIVAETSVESILSADPNSHLTASTRDKLSSQLGYQLSYLPLNSWDMKNCGVFKLKNGAAIAKFDFSNKSNPGEQLTCYQAPQGTIHSESISEKTIGTKKVKIGKLGSYQFALFSQNSRDYLFVTNSSSASIERIISEV